MKKIILLTAFLLAAIAPANAEKIDGRVSVDNVRIERSGESVRITYRVSVPRGAVKRGYTLLFSPFVSSASGEYRQSLPAVAVRGRGTRLAAERGAWVSDIAPENITHLAVGQSATLTATVPFQEWMTGAQLVIDAVEGGCCSYTELAEVRIDAALAPASAPAPRPAAVPAAAPVVAAWEPVTLADSLSTAFTFVLPASEYDEHEPFKIYDDERENALVVYYRVGKHDIDPAYMDNAHTLSNLINVIRMIVAASDSRVERVVVAGFASPEGSFELNDRLAFDRAVTIKRRIMDATGLADRSIEIFNGSVDWRGLRAMVARSSLPEKQRILSIIDYTPTWASGRRDDRLGELTRLDGGRTYRYLLNEYFPYLRSGAFIRVYYEND